MQKIVVLDIETKKSFDEVEGRRPELLEVSLVGLYRYDTDSFHTYEEHELSQLNNILGQTEHIIGFNIKSFDYPVLQPYLQIPLQKFKTTDILEDIKTAIGHRVSLNNVAKATLNSQKSGDGLEAIQLYRNGQIEKLKNYCLQDVKLTKEIYDYGIKHGKIHYLSKDGQKSFDITIQWKIETQENLLF